MSIQQSPGRGRRQCPACKSYMGIRTIKCECGHEFQVKEKQPAQEPAPPPPVAPNRVSLQCLVITTPAGKCPIKLASSERAAVHAWVEALYRHGEQHNRTYSSDALRYWVRNFYEIHDPVYRTICEHIDSYGLFEEEEVSI